MPLFTPEMSTGYCPECAAEQPVEQVPCLDGHGADCPERACIACGTALLMGGPAALLVASEPLVAIRGAA